MGGSIQSVIINKLQVIETFLPLGCVGNNLFLLISGYFMIGKNKSNVTGIAYKLLSQLLLATMLLIIVPNFVVDNQNYHYYLYSINIFNNSSWFVGYYFLVVLIGSLFLNKYLQSLDNKKYISLLMTLFAIVSFTWSRSLLNDLASGLNTLVVGVFMYSLGGYLKKYTPFGNIKTIPLFVLLFLTNSLIWISQYNNMENNIDECFRNGASTTFTHSFIYFDNHSLIVIMLAVIIFELFRRIPTFKSKIINYISASTFMAYLLHDNTFFIYYGMEKID